MGGMSKQSEAILRCLSGTTSHPTADWIYESVRREIPDISLGTVYRNLRRLKEEGRIMELDLGSGMSRFDAKAKNHYHFRCNKCGRVFDVDEPVDDSIDRRIAQKTGFKIDHHLLEFRGLCIDCQR